MIAPLYSVFPPPLLHSSCTNNTANTPRVRYKAVHPFCSPPDDAFPPFAPRSVCATWCPPRAEHAGVVRLYTTVSQQSKLNSVRHEFFTTIICQSILFVTFARPVSAHHAEPYVFRCSFWALAVFSFLVASCFVLFVVMLHRRFLCKSYNGNVLMSNVSENPFNPLLFSTKQNAKA